MIPQNLEIKGQASYQFFHLYNKRNAWYFQCLEITYDSNKHQKMHFLNTIDQSWANPLGMYNIWLVEQEEERHDFKHWMINTLAYYSDKIQQNPGHNYRTSQGRQAKRILRELLDKAKSDGFYNLLSETYTNLARKYRRGNEISKFIAMVGKEEVSHKLEKSIRKTQKFLERQYNMFRDQEIEEDDDFYDEPDFEEEEWKSQAGEDFQHFQDFYEGSDVEDWDDFDNQVDYGTGEIIESYEYNDGPQQIQRPNQSLQFDEFSDFNEYGGYYGVEYQVGNNYYDDMGAFQDSQYYEFGYQEGKLKEREPLTAKSKMIGDPCIICLEEFKIGDRTLDLEVCEHEFHSKCIKEWLKKKYQCPLCQRSLHKNQIA